MADISKLKLPSDDTIYNIKDANAARSSHTHGNITNDGALQTTDIAIASGDKLVVTDSSNSNKVARTSLSFDGSTTTKCLTKKGTWESFTNNAGNVIGSGLTANTIILGNDNSAVKTSSVTIATSSTGVTDDDANVPTSKSVKSFVEGKGYTAHDTCYGTCANTPIEMTKVVSCSSFVLYAGAICAIQFTDGFGEVFTGTTATLNINSTGAKVLHYRGAEAIPFDLAPKDIITVMYTGTYYEIISIFPGVQPEAQGDDVISAVTVAEKYVWNHKQDALTRPVTGAATWTAADVIVTTNANSGNAVKSSGATIATSVTNVDTTVPTSKAVKTYVDTELASIAEKVLFRELVESITFIGTTPIARINNGLNYIKISYMYCESTNATLHAGTDYTIDSYGFIYSNDASHDSSFIAQLRLENVDGTHIIQKAHTTGTNLRDLGYGVRAVGYITVTMNNKTYTVYSKEDLGGWFTKSVDYDTMNQNLARTTAQVASYVAKQHSDI